MSKIRVDILDMTVVNTVVPMIHSFPHAGRRGWSGCHSRSADPAPCWWRGASGWLAGSLPGLLGRPGGVGSGEPGNAAVPVAVEFIAGRMVAGGGAADLVAEALATFRAPLGERARLSALDIYGAWVGLAGRRLTLTAVLDDCCREIDGGGGEVTQAPAVAASSIHCCTG